MATNCRSVITRGLVWLGVFKRPESLEYGGHLQCNWGITGLLLALVVVGAMTLRLTTAGVCSMVAFPEFGAMAGAEHPEGPVGSISQESLRTGVLHNGPEGALGTTQCFEVVQTLEQMALGTLRWNMPCASGAHWGTRVPLMVMRLPEGGGSMWLETLSQWLVGPIVPTNVSCADVRCKDWTFTAMDAVTAARGGDVLEGMPPWMVTEVGSPRQFLAMANAHCEHHTNATQEVLETMYGCPLVGGKPPVVPHTRWTFITCNGNLVSPLAPGTFSKPLDVFMAHEYAACAQTAEDLLWGVPGLCVGLQSANGAT